MSRVGPVARRCLYHRPTRWERVEGLCMDEPIICQIYDNRELRYFGEKLSPR